MKENCGCFKKESNCEDKPIMIGVPGPRGLIGPTGPQGIQGPTGPTGPAGSSPNSLRASYLVTFNDDTSLDGKEVASNNSIPIERVELDVSNLLTLDSTLNTIKFNVVGYYKIDFTISAYPKVNAVDFDPKTDYVSVGFRQTGTDNVYVGVGEWIFNGEPVQLTANGIVSIPDITKTYEFANLGKQTIYLQSPNLDDIASKSYFSNPLVTIVIEYLGRGGS